MLLRISLIIAILAGAATFYVAHFQVGPKIEGLNTQVADLTTQNTTLQSETSAAKAAQKKATEEMEAAVASYNTATNELSQARQLATQQETRANRLDTDLRRVTEERNESQRELAQWRATGVPIEQIARQRDDIRNLQQERDVLRGELTVATRENRRIANELQKYKGTDAEVELPTGLKGKVVAVDPKYNFVVLDIGEQQGVLRDGKMIINRDGKLIAKVRITQVRPNQSVANVIPEWQRDEIMEGDQVLY
ncbi:MAG TPA: hypothetical protein VEH27_09510 [Methylomirabilota bacterium]|nr:hypothetical protein [Methylomirabilota bacterium]